MNKLCHNFVDKLIIMKYILYYMTGGLLQLAAYGSEDMYLTGNPQITFFKIVFRRHTNFSQEMFEMNMLDKTKFGKKNKVQLLRVGDLVTKMFLRIEISSVIPENGAKFAWVRRLGHAIIKSVYIEIGGIIIDKHYGEWIDIWYELARQGTHERGYAHMIGDVPILTAYNDKIKPQYVLFIPLIFWFNRFNGLALPIIAIQYHNIFIHVHFNQIEKLIIFNQKFLESYDFSKFKILHSSLLVNFIYLDTNERNKFATMRHEYLIEQLQFNIEKSVKNLEQRIELRFINPVKEIIWIMKNGNYTSGSRFLCYTHEEDWTNIIKEASRKLLENSITLINRTKCTIDDCMIHNREKMLIDEKYEDFFPQSEGITKNGKIIVKNFSMDKTLRINCNSLKLGSYSITSKISATIIVSINNTITITDLETEITERDISIPIDKMIDTRFQNDNDVFINQYTNYGLLISGKINPFDFAQLDYNDYQRVNKQNGKFFNFLQPEMHHSNTPKDGINVYSFSLEPEKHQPMGTSNMSRIDKIILLLWLKDSIQKDNVPDLDFINMYSRIYVFATSYNILRVMNGLIGLSYYE